ncbi:hypothetical protein Agub_g10824, partial [Astrephomene gubernaculifera]
MSKGVPIAQRPDLKDASLTTRLDAVFGSLGLAAGSGGWSLRQDVQPFRAGAGVEEYNYSSDEEDPNEGLRPVMPSRLVDSDDENADGNGRDDVPPLERADSEADAEEGGIGGVHAEERAARERERLRASLTSRRAFEAEAEEDEFDRFATGTMDMRNRLVDAKPPGSTEVPLTSAWERMHGRLQQQLEDQEEAVDMEAERPVSQSVHVAEGTTDAGQAAAAGMDVDTARAGNTGTATTSPTDATNPTTTTITTTSSTASPASASRKRPRGSSADTATAAAPGGSSAPPATTSSNRSGGGGDVATGDAEML